MQRKRSGNRSGGIHFIISTDHQTFIQNILINFSLTHTFIVLLVMVAIGGHSNIDGLAQDCSNSSALAMELQQSCAKPSI